MSVLSLPLISWHVLEHAGMNAHTDFFHAAQCTYDDFNQGSLGEDMAWILATSSCVSGALCPLASHAG